jgi:hypothetical protein
MTGATQVTEVYQTYVGPGPSGAVQYAFSIPLAVDSMMPWIGVSATLQSDDEVPTAPGDRCATETGRSRISASTCALVYADPALATP